MLGVVSGGTTLAAPVGRGEEVAPGCTVVDVALEVITVVAETTG